jgi:HAD superfamily hydrolase (TIGR01509 family)
MLKGVIFDLDGVVIDSHPLHKRAWKLLFTRLDKQVSEQELEFVVEGQKREDILRHFLGALSDRQVRDYGEQKEALFKNIAAEIQPIQGLPEFLAQLYAANLAMAVASSAGRHRVEHNLRQVNLHKHFQAVVTGEDVIEGKPNPAIFALAAAKMRLQAGEILVCEDAVNGVQAAKAAGMRCLAVAANGRAPLLKKAGADKIVLDFTQARLDELRRLFE